jgi:adenylate kinase
MIYKAIALILTTFYLNALTPVIILVGPPGSGKGTFSQHLKENYGYNHMSVGDLLRLEIAKGTPTGMQIADVVKKGEDVHPSILHSLVESEIVRLTAEGKPLIVDGFMRLERDRPFMQDLLARLGLLDVAIGVEMQADDTQCQQRILQRQVCMECGHVYNKVSAPALIENHCDFCKCALHQRVHDTLETVNKRIQDYRSRTQQQQHLGISDYPNWICDGSLPLDECLSNYSTFAEEISQFEGTAAEWINLVRSAKEEGFPDL